VRSWNVRSKLSPRTTVYQNRKMSHYAPVAVAAGSMPAKVAGSPGDFSPTPVSSAFIVTPRARNVTRFQSDLDRETLSSLPIEKATIVN
jgi:hypothetical protein